MRPERDFEHHTTITFDMQWLYIGTKILSKLLLYELEECGSSNIMTATVQLAMLVDIRTLLIELRMLQQA